MAPECADHHHAPLIPALLRGRQGPAGCATAGRTGPETPTGDGRPGPIAPRVRGHSAHARGLGRRQLPSPYLDAPASPGPPPHRVHDAAGYGPGALRFCGARACVPGGARPGCAPDGSPRNRPARRRSGPGAPRAVMSPRDSERPCRAPSRGRAARVPCPPRATGRSRAPLGDRRRDDGRARARFSPCPCPDAPVPSAPAPVRPRIARPAVPPDAAPMAFTRLAVGCATRTTWLRVRRSARRGRRHGVPSGTGGPGAPPVTPTRHRHAPPPRSPATPLPRHPRREIHRSGRGCVLRPGPRRGPPGARPPRPALNMPGSEAP